MLNFLCFIIFLYSPRISRSTTFDCMWLLVFMSYPESRFGLVVTDIDYLSMRAGNRLMKKLQVLKQIIGVQSYGIRVYKNNFIYHHIEDNMKWLIQGGFPQRHLQFIKDTILWLPKDDGKIPQVFSIDDLQFGFIIWVISCGVSLSAFLLEVLYSQFKMRLKYFIETLLGLIFVIHLIRNRLRRVVL